MSEKAWSCQTESWGWGICCPAFHTRQRYCQALSLCGCHSSAKQTLPKFSSVVWWLIFGYSEGHNLMNIICTKNACCIHWTALPEILTSCVFLVHKSCAKQDCFGFCTGVNEPGLGIMLHGYFESLSGSNAKGAFGWKSSWYKLNSGVLCVFTWLEVPSSAMRNCVSREEERGYVLFCPTLFLSVCACDDL